VGRGGRCSEFLLALYAHSKDLAGLSALAADTDGIDGSEENAGAYFDQEIIHHANTLQLDEKTYLDAHDAYGFFLEVGGLVHTGPTLTNINDFRILMLESHG
jgi:hydroxypyruvate reductase